MSQRVGRVLSVMAFLLAMAGAATATVRSKFIIVESPSDLPELAQGHSEAMHLQYIDSGQVILYLEQDAGRKLAILDVTDPGKIQALGTASLPASSPYDFVQDLPDSSVLVHYRDHSGFAAISFRNYREPVLTGEPDYVDASSVQSYGVHGLLLVSSNAPDAPAQAKEQYEILSASNSTDPAPLATIGGVIQRLDRPQTGTIFLLSDDGLNVVRCLATERVHEESIANHRN